MDLSLLSKPDRSSIILSASRTKQATHSAIRQARFRSAVLWFLSLPLLTFLLTPIVALVARVSLADLLSNLVDRQVAQAVGLSMVTTLTTMLVAVVAGTPVAYLLARRRFRGRTGLDTLIDLPMILPPSVAGIALLMAFGRRGLIGHYLDDVGIEIAFTQIAVVLAQTFVATPYYVKSAAAGFASVDHELEQAAALDGATSLQAFRHVTLPLAWRALVGGAAMTLARALGEFGATIIFAGNLPGRTQTMPLAIYIGFELNLNTALALALILLVASFAILLVVKSILHQSVRNL